MFKLRYIHIKVTAVTWIGVTHSEYRKHDNLTLERTVPSLCT